MTTTEVVSRCAGGLRRWCEGTRPGLKSQKDALICRSEGGAGGISVGAPWLRWLTLSDARHQDSDNPASGARAQAFLLFPRYFRLLCPFRQCEVRPGAGAYLGVRRQPG